MIDFWSTLREQEKRVVRIHRIQPGHESSDFEIPLFATHVWCGHVYGGCMTIRFGPQEFDLTSKGCAIPANVGHASVRNQTLAVLSDVEVFFKIETRSRLDWLAKKENAERAILAERKLEILERLGDVRAITAYRYAADHLRARVQRDMFLTVVSEEDSPRSLPDDVGERYVVTEGRLDEIADEIRNLWTEAKGASSGEVEAVRLSELRADLRRFDEGVTLGYPDRVQLLLSKLRAYLGES